MIVDLFRHETMTQSIESTQCNIMNRSNVDITDEYSNFSLDVWFICLFFCQFSSLYRCTTRTHTHTHTHTHTNPRGRTEDNIRLSRNVHLHVKIEKKKRRTNERTNEHRINAEWKWMSIIAQTKQNKRESRGAPIKPKTKECVVWCSMIDHRSNGHDWRRLNDVFIFHKKQNKKTKTTITDRLIWIKVAKIEWIV
jgi:hypothetical protein